MSAASTSGSSSTSWRSLAARRRASATFEPELGSSCGRGSSVSSASQSFLRSSVSSSSTGGSSAARLGSLHRRGERLEAVEQGAADRVRGGDQLRGGPEVPGQRQRDAVRLIPLGEPPVLAAVDLDVGVPEPVDRLELVADQEQAGVRAAQLLDQPELEAVRVLELVDHQVAELLPVAVTQQLRAGQEPDRSQLQVLEVQRRALRLQLLVAAAEPGDELAQLLVGGGEHEGRHRRPRPLQRRRVAVAGLTLEVLPVGDDHQGAEPLEELLAWLGTGVELGRGRDPLAAEQALRPGRLGALEVCFLRRLDQPADRGARIDGRRGRNAGSG